MDSVSLKKRLIDRIQSTESEILLEEVQRLLDLQEFNEGDVYQLNEEQQNAIAEAREDIRKKELLDQRASAPRY